jgi:tryptophanyl-tRNA synthetase
MPIQEKYNQIIESGRINEILDAGRDYSIKIAAEKYEKVRKAVGFGRI